MGVAIGLAAAAAVIMGGLVYLFYENKRKQNDSVWQIKEGDIKFAEPAEVLGRGTFGLVSFAFNIAIFDTGSVLTSILISSFPLEEDHTDGVQYYVYT